jgi:hypothetical protein
MGIKPLGRKGLTMAASFPGSDTKQLRTATVPLARRLNLGVWLSRFAGPVATLVAVFAAVLLLLKMVAPDLAPYSWLIFAVLPIIMLGTSAWCRKKDLFFTLPEIAELADYFTRSDGRLTTAFERPGLFDEPSFYKQVASLVKSRLPRFDAKWYATRFLPVAAFAAAAIMIPPRQPETPKSQQVLAAITQPISEQLQATQELLPEKEREEIQKQLEEIQKTPAAVSKEQWEAVEEIQHKVDNAVEQAQATAQQVASQVSDLANMTGNHQGDSTPMGDSPTQQSMDSIIQDLTLKAENPAVPLNAKQRSALKSAMGKAKAGQLKKAELKNLERDLKSLCEKLGQCKSGQCSGNGNGPIPGRGGVNRGRADAELVLGEEKHVEGAQFDEKELENQYMAPEDLMDLGVVPVEPKTEPGTFSASGVKSFGEESGANVSRTRISPSQRSAVSKYFGQDKP